MITVDTVAAAPVPPIPAHGLLTLLIQIAALLISATALGGLAKWLGAPRIVGELLAGVLVGPSILGNLAPAVEKWLFPPQVEQVHMLDAVGQVGLLLLVGIAGAHLDVRAIRDGAARAAKVSLGGLIVPLACGIGVGLLVHPPLRPEGTSPIVFALFIGIAVCVSAIPVIAKTLMELDLTRHRVGQLILIAGAIDDAVAWLLLAVVSAAAVNGLQLFSVLGSIGASIGVLAATMLIGRPVVGALMRRTDRSGDTGSVVAVAATLMIAGAVGTQAVGLEAFFGTLIIGVLIGSSGIDMSKLTPLKTIVMSVLAPIYFAAAGLRMDLSTLVSAPVLLTAVAILAVAIGGKFCGAYLGGRWSGLDRREAMAVGVGMNARGVVEVVIAMTGLRLGVLDTPAYTVLILVAIVTSVMAPPLLRRVAAPAPEPRTDGAAVLVGSPAW
ncbi:cation:proton antiporter [Nocardia tengchongensis]|uniref:cation:proton antiporter n=1 Tax=Nocardia tengchongensis TaxID=2055889 RepID=UPI003677EDD4